MHYAKKYKKEINRLKRVIDTYYHAIFELKEDVGLRQGVYCGLSRLEGHEERLVIMDFISVQERIDDLPLIDPGMIIKE